VSITESITEKKTTTIILPTETWQDEPENHNIQHDEILGWLVRRNGSESAMMLPDEEAKMVLEYWDWLKS
jgi:hypothetical protein